MLTQTIGRFENTEDLIDWLKSFGYEKVLRTFPDVVILESEKENALVFRKDNLVAFSHPLEECDLECADKENSLEPLVLQTYGGGGFFWFKLTELAVCTDDNGNERICILMESGDFFDIIS